MSLISGQENRLIDIERVTTTEDDYGGRSESESTVASDVICKIDYTSGSYPTLIAGKQARSTNLLFCDASTDIRPRDRIINVRNKKTGEVDKVNKNGTLVAAVYEVEWVSEPGSEDDHLEVLIYRFDGQTA